MVKSAVAEPAELEGLETYSRIPFDVKSIQVTEDNIDQVASWVKGPVKQDGDKKYIKVKVHSPKNPRQSQAFVTDWVLLSAQGFKVYTDKAFRSSFQRISQ